MDVLEWLPHKDPDCTGTWRFVPGLVVGTRFIRCDRCRRRHPYTAANRDAANAEIVAGLYMRELTEVTP